MRVLKQWPLQRLSGPDSHLARRIDEMDSPNDHPTHYDGTQLLIRVRLPDHDLTIADVYDHVYGMHLNHGAKPWPYYRDAGTGKWWSLSTNADTSLDRLAWMISLDQLHYHPRPEAEDFLHTVYSDLKDAAERIGGTAEPECDVDDALSKMDRVVELLAIRDVEMTILVRAPDGGAYTVAEWWQSCEKSGLTYGDGNLFWLLNEKASEDNDEPYEYFSVQPYSQPGYFHRSDLNSSIAFPDVALSFRVRDFNNPHDVLDKMIAIASLLADNLGATVAELNGSAFDASVTKRRLDQAIQKRRELETTR